MKKGKDLTQEEREENALEAIMVGCLRGFTEEDWQKVFKRVKEKEGKKP